MDELEKKVEQLSKEIIRKITLRTIRSFRKVKGITLDSDADDLTK